MGVKVLGGEMAEQGGYMRVSKVIMAVLLIWMVPSAWMPLFGYMYEVPYTIIVIDVEAANWRVHSIRSAAFMTVAYFIVSYFRHQRPLSSVLPVLVFSYWLFVFRVATLAIYPQPWTEWILVFAFIVLNIVLTIEHMRDSNRIFKDSW